MYGSILIDSKSGIMKRLFPDMKKADRDTMIEEINKPLHLVSFDITDSDTVWVRDLECWKQMLHKLDLYKRRPYPHFYAETRESYLDYLISTTGFSYYRKTGGISPNI